MRKKTSTSQLMKYSGFGLIAGAAIGMLIGTIFGLEKVGEGLIFGALAGIVFGPAVGTMKIGQSKKE